MPWTKTADGAAGKQYSSQQDRQDQHPGAKHQGGRAHATTSQPRRQREQEGRASHAAGQAGQAAEAAKRTRDLVKGAVEASRAHPPQPTA